MTITNHNLNAYSEDSRVQAQLILANAHFDVFNAFCGSLHHGRRDRLGKAMRILEHAFEYQRAESAVIA